MNDMVQLLVLGMVCFAVVAGCAGDGSVHAYLGRLKNGTAEQKIAAIHRLDGLNDARAVPALCAALNDPDAGVRSAAAACLVFLHNESALEPLIRALEDDVVPVRRHAAYALEQMNDARAVPALAALLKDPEEYVRFDAAVALGNIGDSVAAPALVEALGDSSPVVYNEVIKALALVGDKASLPAITAALRSDAWKRNVGEWQRTEALRGFAGALKCPEAVPLLHELCADTKEALVGDDGTETRPTVVARDAAFILAVHYHDPYGAPVLRDYLGGDDYSLQQACIALGRLKHAAAAADIYALMGRTRWETNRRVAMDALVAIGGTGVRPYFEELMKDDDPVVRQRAAGALGRTLPGNGAGAASPSSSYSAPPEVLTVCVPMAGSGSIAAGDAFVPARKAWGGRTVPAKSLAGLPGGDAVFRGIPFRLSGRVAAVSRRKESAVPASVAVPVRGTGATVYFLHASADAAYGKTAGAYVVEYADGGVERVPVTVGREVLPMEIARDHARSRLAWVTADEENEARGLFIFEWTNPRPGHKILSVTVEAANGDGALVLAGITLSNQGPVLAGTGKVRGLVPHIAFMPPVTYFRDGTAPLNVRLLDVDGTPVDGADVRAAVNGATVVLKGGGDGRYGAMLVPPRADAPFVTGITVQARKGGTVFPDAAGLLYNRGVPRLFDAPVQGTPPQFIVLGVDDIRNMEGTLEIVRIVNDLAQRGARVPFSLYVTSFLDRSKGQESLERCRVLWQRLYNTGSEICNHTMNHNLNGVYWRNRKTKPEIVREIEGHRDWLRENIHGLHYLYSFKGGGGSRSTQTYHGAFADSLLEAQGFEYACSRGEHTDIQSWPYKLGERWTIDQGCLDGDAPYRHEFVYRKIHADYPGQFMAASLEDAKDMWMANFEHHYAMPNRPPLIVNAFHDWGFKKGDLETHAYEASGLRAFLEEVLVANKDKYPDTYVVTFHQLIKYMRRPDRLEDILAEGAGQDTAEAERGYPVF